MPCTKTTARRPGWTLIELLVVVTLVAILAGSTCVLIAKMIQTSRIQAEALVRQRSLHMWQVHFMQDGRQARSARIDIAIPTAHRVEFQRPEGTVTYQVIPGGMERLVDGNLGGRWECGRGIWEFSMQDQDRIVRAEFRHAVELPMGSSGPQSTLSLNATNRPRTCVDVTLATSSSRPVPPGAP